MKMVKDDRTVKHPPEGTEVDVMENPENAVRLGLDRLFEEYRLLKKLEAADRSADEKKCQKSLNQKTWLAELDHFRSNK